MRQTTEGDAPWKCAAYITSGGNLHRWTSIPRPTAMRHAYCDFYLPPYPVQPVYLRYVLLPTHVHDDSIDSTVSQRRRAQCNWPIPQDSKCHLTSEMKVNGWHSTNDQMEDNLFSSFSRSEAISVLQPKRQSPRRIYREHKQLP